MKILRDYPAEIRPEFRDQRVIHLGRSSQRPSLRILLAHDRLNLLGHLLAEPPSDFDLVVTVGNGSLLRTIAATALSKSTRKISIHIRDLPVGIDQRKCFQQS